MIGLKKLPPASLPPHRRWAIRCVSGTMMVESGRWTGDCYRYGLRSAGRAVEEVPQGYWGKKTAVAYILETADPDLFEFSRSDRSVMTEATMLVGPEIFTAFGFEAPLPGTPETA